MIAKGRRVVFSVIMINLNYTMLNNNKKATREAVMKHYYLSKKAVLALLSFALVISLCACGTGAGAATPPGDNTSANGTATSQDGIESSGGGAPVADVVMGDTVAAGGTHSLAIKTDGSLWAWGSNNLGQLGDGTAAEPYAPEQVLDNVKSVAAGYAFSMAIKTDGSLWVWGDDSNGSLGDGKSKAISDPQATKPFKLMDNVICVAAGTQSAYAVTADGSLWAWGNNAYGQLGDGTTENHYTPEKIMDGVKSVSAGYTYATALKTDGSLWGWGEFPKGYGSSNGSIVNIVPEPAPVKIIDGVSAASVGGYFGLALKSDGSLWGWGSNVYGVLSSSTDVSGARTPIKVMDGISKVSAGSQSAIAVKTDGSLWGWGMDFSNGAAADDLSSYAPAQILSGVAAVSASVTGSSDAYFAVKTDGSLWAWGNNENGQLGDGTMKNSTTPYKALDSVALPGSAPAPAPSPSTDAVKLEQLREKTITMAGQVYQRFSNNADFIASDLAGNYIAPSVTIGKDEYDYVSPATGFHNVQDVKNYLGRIFSDNVVTELMTASTLNSDAVPMFIDYNGQLYNTPTFGYPMYCSWEQTAFSRLPDNADGGASYRIVIPQPGGNPTMVFNVTIADDGMITQFDYVSESH